MDDRGRELLDFERLTWKFAGSKQRAIRERFDMTETRYYQALLPLLADPGAWAYAPDVVKRLQRRRAG